MFSSVKLAHIFPISAAAPLSGTVAIATVSWGTAWLPFRCLQTFFNSFQM